MIEMASVLSSRGHTVALFASQFDRADARIRDVGGVCGFLGKRGEAVLIYHHSIGWPQGVELASRAKCLRVVRYHNVTPAYYFARYSEELARNCQEGRRQVRTLAHLECDLYLSDSAFNQRELLRAGADARRCRIVPPFHRIDRLNGLAADPQMLADLGDTQTNILYVGRFVPNKNHAVLVRAFALYRRWHDSNCRLLLVGKEDGRLKGYMADLRRRVRQLGLQGVVTFITQADDAVLKACYKRARVFLSASRHEGFCLPLVEAMAMRMPVVARATAAVPETIGPAGLLWARPDAGLLAEAVACAAHDPTVRETLAARGWRRYRQRFAHERIEAMLVDALSQLKWAGVRPAEQSHMFAC
jgi:glycosyltransferase involved in cell wall biosynthesis